MGGNDYQNNSGRNFSDLLSKETGENHFKKQNHNIVKQLSSNKKIN